MNSPLERPVSCLITKGDATPATFLQKKSEIIEIVSKAVMSNVSIVQIREKHLTAKQAFEIATDAVATAAGSPTLVLVNERVDIALASGADGVHLRSDSISPGLVRSVVPHGFIIGVSTHNSDEVLRARDQGADFAVFGPVFSTPGKPSPIGLEELRRTCELAAPFPVLALGGIDASNAVTAIDARAAGFAAIRFMNSNAGLEFVRTSKNVVK